MSLLTIYQADLNWLCGSLSLVVAAAFSAVLVSMRKDREIAALRRELLDRERRSSEVKACVVKMSQKLPKQLQRMSDVHKKSVRTLQQENAELRQQIDALWMLILPKQNRNSDLQDWLKEWEVVVNTLESVVPSRVGCSIKNDFLRRSMLNDEVN